MRDRARKKTTRLATTHHTSPDPRRSAVMRAVRSKGTGAEKLVRAAVRRLGYRVTYNSESLPGKPDLINRFEKKAIFVHGCFWHGHTCKRGNRVPVSNRAYWIEKVNGNRSRHRKALRLLRSLGWSTLTIWECQLSDLNTLSSRLARLVASLPRDMEPARQRGHRTQQAN